MGVFQSKESDVRTEVKEVVREVAVPMPIYIQPELNEQLEELKEEVKTVVPVITDGIKHTFMSQEDVLLMKYSQLDDMDKIKEDIKGMFQSVDDVKILDFIIATATSMISALKHSKEMKEVMRWHQRKLEKRVSDTQVVGMEAHYKVKIEETTSGGIISKKEKETVVLIAYKVMAHILDRAPEDFLGKEELAALTF